MKEKFYITTAIAYTSKKPHIGNTYEIVLTDAIARYKRQRGYDVYFLTGTDEHGQKIEQDAKQMGRTPQQHVDLISDIIKDIAKELNISYDGFIRTTDANHKKIVQKIFKKFFDQGDIYKGSYEGWYCVPCESFFTETQLVDGCCPDCKCKVEKSAEEAYFFKMSNYQDRLIKYIEDNPEFIQPESRKKEMINNFLKPGLQDLCVSRTSFQWGIPVDFDPRHVVYVWIDALANYITALGYDPEGSSELYEKLWPADLHVIGKDILRFHTIYWPIMLMALGLPLPKKVLGHPWLLAGEDKMSKSKGNVMYADDLVKLFGTDGVRYYLLSEMPYAQDGSITFETLISRYNSDLANTVGNLVKRSVTMVSQYFGGKVHNAGVELPVDLELKQECKKAVEQYAKAMDACKLADATESIMVLARRSNKYIDETMPWVLAKDEAQLPRLETVLYNLLEAIRYLGVLLEAIVPHTSAEILKQINAEETTFDSLQQFGNNLEKTVGSSEILFSRLNEKEMKEKIEALYPQPVVKEQPPKEVTKAKEETNKEDINMAIIGIEDFAKVSLQVAKVVSCEKVKKSDKLYKLQVSLGTEERQVVSGIAPYYQVEELVGKKVILVSNLAPAVLRGEESQGMILAADGGNRGVTVVFLPEDVPEGTKIR